MARPKKIMTPPSNSSYEQSWDRVFGQGKQHLCLTCGQSYPGCTGNPVFGIDRDFSLRGKAADVVESCDGYRDIRGS